MIGIYCLLNHKNKKRYVGQSKNLIGRKHAHFSALRHNKHQNKYLQDDWNIYGKEFFEFVILEELDDATLLDDKERYYISLYQSNNREYGYNLESGGTKNKLSHEETKRKISENHADVSGEKNPFFHKKHSQEVINQIINNPNYINRKHKGEESHNCKITEEIAREIKQYFSNPENNKYGEITKIANKYGISTQIVSHIKNGHAWGWLSA